MSTAKLNKQFDAPALANDYDRICQRIANRPAGFEGEGHVGWSSMCLFSNTVDKIDLLDEAPAIRALLRELGLSLRLVRIMRLQAGGIIRRHQDTFLSDRIVRLHVPIMTNEQVKFFIDDCRCNWNAGELWYGDFSRPHWGANESDVERVHLVLDVNADDALARLFNEGEVPRALEAHCAALEHEVAPSMLNRFQIDFDLPQGFHLPGVFDRPLQVPVPGCVRLIDSELCVFVNQQPLLKAVPTAEDQLIIVGLGIRAILHYEFVGDRPVCVQLVLGELVMTISCH